MLAGKDWKDFQSCFSASRRTAADYRLAPEIGLPWLMAIFLASLAATD
jgi:hypothetical protein